MFRPHVIYYYYLFIHLQLVLYRGQYGGESGAYSGKTRHEAGIHP